MRVAVIGAGPIGIEAALALRASGHSVTLLEAALEPAGAVAAWGSVRLFTPWSMNTSERGRAALPEEHGLDDPVSCPLASEWRARYLAPLAEQLGVHCDHRVLQVGRGRRRKGDALGSQRRIEEPFRLLVGTGGGEVWLEADAVIDATGTFSDPAPLGPGGMSVPGESVVRAAHLVRYGPVGVDDLAGARVLLVGDGASAVTQLRALRSLDPPARTIWLTVEPDGPGFTSPDDDVLPERAALHSFGRSSTTWVDHRPGVFLSSVALEAGSVVVKLDDGSEMVVDHIVGCTGFRPDHSLSRELQVHLCWGTEGTMKLAAHLVSTRGGGGGDCLAQPGAGGIDLLRSPEPRFFVVGSKSYGRRSDFLLQAGHAQVDDVVLLLAED